MKGSKGYIIFILVLLGILWAVSYKMPRKFVWNPTFSQYDKQPFGAAIFDDILSASLPDEYVVTDKTFYQLEQDSLVGVAVLAVDDELMLTRVDAQAILNMVEHGNKVMLVTRSLGYTLPDTLNLRLSTGFFSSTVLRSYASKGYGRDSVCWLKDDLYDETYFYAYPHFFWSHFSRYDSLATVLAAQTTEYEEEYLPVALKYTIGDGELYLVSTPLIFTNYGMLDGNNSAYIFRLLTQMKGMPLIRTEGYGKVHEDPKTPLRYFLSQPPLRWGIYLTFILLILFMIFTAKRKQRIIPVVRTPENKALEFVELIGTLYFQKKDHADLVRKKYLYFADLLRRDIQVDLDNGDDNKVHARKIAEKTGADKDSVYRLLNALHQIKDDQNRKLTKQEMQTYIDEVNKIIGQI